MIGTSILLRIRKHRIFLCGLLHLSLYSMGTAAAHNSADSLKQNFSQAFSYYQSERYTEAASLFSELVSIKSRHPYSSPAMLMQGQILYKQNRYYASVSALEEFLQKYSTSDYVPYAHYLLGNSYYNLNDSKSALKEFLTVCESVAEQELINRANLKALCLNSPEITVSYLDTLSQEFSGDLVKNIIQIKKAEMLVDQNQLDEAQKIIKLVLQKMQSSAVKDYVNDLSQFISATKTQPPVIGVISNFSSEEGEQERRFFNGLWLAFKEYNKKTEKPVKITVRDAEGSMLKAISLTKELSHNPNIVAIIGPLSSELAIGSALESEHSGIPCLVPAAQEPGIAALGPWVFQITADYGMQGAVISMFAMNKLNLSTFATVAPISKISQELTKGFVNTVVKERRKLIDQVWYYSGTTSFNRQLDNLRKLSLENGNQQTIRTPVSSNPLDSLESAYFGNRVQKLPAPPDSQTTIGKSDNLEVPVRSLDALFLPIQTEDIKYVAPQLAVYNFRTQLLGTNAWYDAATLANQENYVNGIYFTTNYIVNEYDLSFINFRNTFRQEMQTTPGMMEVKGFDIGNLLITVIKSSASNRVSVRQGLAQIKDFQGISCHVHFDSTGANTWVPIMQYEKGVIKFIQ